MRQSNGRMKTGTFNPKMFDDEMIIGLLLSDAHLLKIKNQFQNSQFQITASIKHSEFIDFIEKYLNDLGFSTYKKTYVRELGETINLNTERHPFFTELRRIWYPNGIKIVPESITLTPRSIAYWFMGDGSSSWYQRGNKKARIMLSTDGFDVNSVINLQWQLMNLDMRFYLRFSVGNTRPYLEAKKSEFVYRFMNTIKSHMLPCFYYKIKEPYVNSKVGVISLWKNNNMRQKCMIDCCENTAINGRKACNMHKGKEGLIPRKPIFIPKWKIDSSRRKCMFSECIRVAVVKRKVCEKHKGYTKKRGMFTNLNPA